MPRPCKKRRVCKVPTSKGFIPVQANCCQTETINMTVDEYETIRLIDVEDYTQEECAKSMDVARSTVQAIYASARTKIGRSLVEGYPLNVLGGDYQVCQGGGCGCKKNRCHKHNLQMED